MVQPSHKNCGTDFFSLSLVIMEPNKILKLSISSLSGINAFKFLQGWGLRAGEAILRGTFICEYAGEVIDELEGDERHDRSELM